MRTNIDIDQELIAQAMNLTNIETKKGIVEFALRELISSLKRKSILDYRGKIQWQGNLDDMRKIT